MPITPKRAKLIRPIINAMLLFFMQKTKIF
jgi:hypothetical protein